METERVNPALETLPVPLSGTEEADQGLRTRTGCVGEPETPDSPKESWSLTLFLSEAECQGGGRNERYCFGPSIACPSNCFFCSFTSNVP